MEVQRFDSSAQLMQWIDGVVKAKDQHHRYERALVGPQIWKYGDGTIVETIWGQKRGTVLSNLRYMLSTGTGALAHSRDAQIVNEVDVRGGVILTINWAGDAVTGE
jgi:hypothetical protein